MDINTFYWSLSYVHLSFFGLVILSGLITFSKSDSLGRWFLAYLSCMFLICLASLVLAKYGIRNLFLGNWEIVTETLLIGLWFPLTFRNQRSKHAARWMAVLILAVLAIEMVGWQRMTDLGDTAAMVKCLAIITCSTLGIVQLMANEGVPRLSRVPYLWFFIGLLVTNTFSCLFNVFRGDLLGYSTELFIEFACLDLLLQICAFSLYGYVFWILY